MLFNQFNGPFRLFQLEVNTSWSSSEPEQVSLRKIFGVSATIYDTALDLCLSFYETMKNVSAYRKLPTESVRH